MNSTGDLGHSEYDEYLLSEISQTDDVSMLDLVSQSQLSQEVVNLVTQNPAPVKAEEELPADERKPPAQENILFAYLFIGG
jgi:hypothetical protein